MGTFSVEGDHFSLNGQPFRILSGGMHYFRVPRPYWDDRLYKLRALGLNTLETYVAWDLHEPRPGEFHFEDNLDLVTYIRRAESLGLYVIVRPGPYICSEWDFGGLPPWLLKYPAMQVRCNYAPYHQAVDRYFDALLPQLVPLQISHGGPVIAVQVENEYGSYGNDRAYMEFMAAALRGRGIDCMLFTSDGEAGATLHAGTLPEIYKTVNFAFQPARAFNQLRKFQPEAPLMCTEYWDGWFDHWGEPHHLRSAQDTAATLDEMLAVGASVNLYMFHGGTNFGFMNGANVEGETYQPDVTSYDYDAPLSEDGQITPKYEALRQVIGKYAPLPDMLLPGPVPRIAQGGIELNQSAPLFDVLPALSTPVHRVVPQPMEALDQNYGFILYRTQIAAPYGETTLTLCGLHDRAQVFLNGRSAGVLERATPDPLLPLYLPQGGVQLDILVENMGRVNFGPHLMDRKGILGGVSLGKSFLFDWTIFPLPLDDLSRLEFAPAADSYGPAFYRGSFTLAEVGDTFLGLPGWTKGVAWVNGFNLGRYWNRGPQQTLYLPAPLLRPGENELVVFELHNAGQRRVELRDRPDLG
jgi:beta-galactosidase